MNPAPIAAAAAPDGIPWLLIIALIGAGAALFGHLVLRSNARLANDQLRENAALTARLSAHVKLADMRQDWINKLRNDMTRFFALCNEKRDCPEKESKRQIHECGTRIELRMNPMDQDYEELRRSMFAIYLDVPPGSTAEELDDRYVAVCQRILKREWDQLKHDIENSLSAQAASADTQPVPWYRRPY